MPASLPRRRSVVGTRVAQLAPTVRAAGVKL